MNRLAGFTGLPAQIFKICFIAIIDAILVAMFFASTHKHATSLAIVIALVAFGTNFVYFAKFTLPFKFLFPGLVLLVVFVVVPILYTISMSAFNYKTGNEISKGQAITQLLQTGLAPDAANTSYDMVLGKKNGDWAALLTEQSSQQVYLGTQSGTTKLEKGTYSLNGIGVAGKAPGFVPLTAEQTASADSVIGALKFPLGNGQFIAPQSADVAVLLTQSLVYDQQTDTFTNTTLKRTYKDNGDGNFANIADKTEKLSPGWRAFNNFRNYTHLFSDPTVRGPFIGVFIWTVSFAFLTVIMMFGVGFLLAIALDKKIAFRRFYRSILILPYAIPSFMSILIWNGLFNRQFGAINGLFHTNIDWFNSPWLAKGVILLVNLWLGFPYFYLISTGALQAIPVELEEAASIDGASPRKVLRLIKLPLMLQILSPLLISSFAFNFNNFNLIYLLTAGGPTDVLHGKTAGATDILITYTYKTAFGSSEQNLGLACAISMIMFFIVGSLSLWSLRRSKVLDGF
ncbi:MAG: ABC transporter permease subunit [Actinomycetes bacterium]